MAKLTEAMIPLVRQIIRDELATILQTEDRTRSGLRKALVDLMEAELDERWKETRITIGPTDPPALTLPVIRPDPFTARIVALFNDPPPELRAALEALIFTQRESQTDQVWAVPPPSDNPLVHWAYVNGEWTSTPLEDQG